MCFYIPKYESQPFIVLLRLTRQTSRCLIIFRIVQSRSQCIPIDAAKHLKLDQNLLNFLSWEKRANRFASLQITTVVVLQANAMEDAGKPLPAFFCPITQEVRALLWSVTWPRLGFVLGFCVLAKFVLWGDLIAKLLTCFYHNYFTPLYLSRSSI